MLWFITEVFKNQQQSGDGRPQPDGTGMERLPEKSMKKRRRTLRCRQIICNCTEPLIGMKCLHALKRNIPVVLLLS